jgi:hypothetical protein
VDKSPADELGTREVPLHWLLGEFDLEVIADSITFAHVDHEVGLLRGVSGRAWVKLPCARPLVMVTPTVKGPRFSQALEVVDEVLHPGTQLSLADARTIRTDVQIGENVAIDFAVDRSQLREIVELGRGVHGWLDTDPAAARFLVEFDDLTVNVAVGHGQGTVLEGTASYPIVGRVPRSIELDIAGFTIVITAFTLDPRRSTADAEVRLPASAHARDAATSGPATIDLGRIRLPRTCDYIVDAPDRAYGPWLLGDTGMVIEGTGFVLDLSTTASAPGWAPTWRGLILRTGTASGMQHIPDPCNSGYLRGIYQYTDATVIASGFFGTLDLTAPVAFSALNPFGQAFSFDGGTLDVRFSAIASGTLVRGRTELLVEAVCDRVPGVPVIVALPAVSVQPDLHLVGTLPAGRYRMAWGELTRLGDEVVAWSTLARNGYVFLPADAVASYSPVSTGAFESPNVSSWTSTSLADLDTRHISGVTFHDFEVAAVYSPDRPGGTSNPIRLDRTMGWVRAGVQGIDGELVNYSGGRREPLGDPAGKGYVGVTAFDTSLLMNDRRHLIAQFVSSAAFDSHFSGSVKLPAPCHIDELLFGEMKLTSTARLVGGDIALPATGVPLGFWGIKLVPTGPPTQTGVLSVRTGRVLFTAAGLEEAVHFARPFGLTWGEVFADGAVGELFLDFNDWGQRFDGLVFHPQELALSRYDPNDTTPYLGVSGAVLFPFFGLHDINVRDATPDPALKPPWPHPRHVTVPKTAITPSGAPTDLALSGVWHDVLSAVIADVECVDAQVDYNENGQAGFLGTGTAEVGFLHSDPLDAIVEIHSDATDVRFTSITAHDLDISVIARLGALGQIAGNLRIEGPTPTRMTVYGRFEQSVATGILGPKAGYEVEANMSVTPMSLDFYASGDMMVSVALVEIEASATVHLIFDFAAGTAEGELLGRVDCDAAVNGLSGEGQLSWFLGPGMQHLQGRVKVEVFSLLGGGGLEGGFFLGNNVPNNLAWALDTTDPKFKMSRALLPATITGIYGYGRASFGVNYYLIGGGVDIFLGAGAFSAPLAAGGPLAPFAGNPLLPFVVGACGINVHGEILGGLVSASAWANLSMRGPIPLYFEGTFGLRGCVAWVLCASVDVTARVSSNGFEIL